VQHASSIAATGAPRRIPEKFCENFDKNASSRGEFRASFDRTTLCAAR
jgi:hypothetical protein